MGLYTWTGIISDPCLVPGFNDPTKNMTLTVRTLSLCFPGNQIWIMRTGMGIPVILYRRPITQDIVSPELPVNHHICSLRLVLHFRTHKSLLITHFSPPVTSRPSCLRKGRMLACDQEAMTPLLQMSSRWQQDEGVCGTYQHAVVAMLVKKQHPRFRRHGNLVFWDFPAAGVENRLTADTAVCGRCEI